MAAVSNRVPNILGLGVDLIPCPTYPGFREVQWGGSNKTAINSSPFTTDIQVLSWPGADAWNATVSLPPLPRYQAARWTAWLQSLNGRVHVFQIGDQLYSPGNPRAPASTLTPAPTYLPLNGEPLGDFALSVAPGAVAGTYTQFLAGAPASATRVLSQGDYVQIDYRMHRVTADVDADANGLLTVPVWPSVREVPAANAIVDIVNPVGLFRLVSDNVQWSYNPDGLVSLSFQCSEVR